MQASALQPQQLHPRGLRGVRLERVERRRLHGPLRAPARHSASQQRVWLALQCQPHRDQAVHHELQSEGRLPERHRLPVGRLDTVERLHLQLRWRPEDAGPPDQGCTEGRWQEMPRGGKERDGALQHAALWCPGLHGRQLGRLVSLGRLLRGLWRRPPVAHQEGARAGFTVRQASAGQRQGAQILQFTRLFGRQRLPVQRLDAVGCMLLLVRRCEAPLPAHRRIRQGQGKMVLGEHEGGRAML
mmetsp:Transcript_138566/g.430950  ORF Transcript_138566/g.430950 Transcript_138566/m.430950 type:complete len:243 (-) Transcript_138566:886-1614(-)